MILVHFAKEADGSVCVRVESNEPRSYSTQLARLSLRAYVAADKRSFDSASRTWRIEPGGWDEFAQWFNFAVLILGVHVTDARVPDRTVESGAGHVFETDEWPEHIRG